MPAMGAGPCFFIRLLETDSLTLSQSLEEWGSKSCRELRGKHCRYRQPHMQKSWGRLLGVFKEQPWGWNGMRERKVGDVGREGTGQQTMQDFGSYFEWDREILEGWAEEGNELHFIRTTDHCVNSRLQKVKVKAGRGVWILLKLPRQKMFSPAG